VASSAPVCPIVNKYSSIERYDEVGTVLDAGYIRKRQSMLYAVRTLECMIADHVVG